jgi:hypothetical protein
MSIFANYCAQLKGVKEKHSWGDNPMFLFSALFILFESWKLLLL